MADVSVSSISMGVAPVLSVQQRLGRGALRLAGALAEVRQARKIRRQLMDLDATALLDVGLSPEQRDREAERLRWGAPRGWFRD